MKRNIIYTMSLLLLAAQLPAQKISGKLNFVQGDTIAIAIQLKNSIVQDAGGQSIDFTVDGSAAHYFNVTNSTADNSTLHHQVRQFTFKFDGMGQKMSFNSDNPKDLKGMMGKPVEEMLTKTYDMIIDPTGKALLVKPEKIEAVKVDERMMIISNMLKDLTNVVFPPEKNMPSFFSVLPAQEVGIGDSWTENSTTPTDKSTTVYTLTAITDSTVLVDFKTRSTIAFKSTMMGVEAQTAMTSNMTGKIILDKASGIIREKTSTGDSGGKVDAMGMSMPVSAKTTLSMQVSHRQ